MQPSIVIGDLRLISYFVFLSLYQGMFERLQMSNTVDNLCIQAGHRLKALNAVMDARDELLIRYLSNCYLRLDREEESLKRKCSKVIFFFWNQEFIYYLFVVVHWVFEA